MAIATIPYVADPGVSKTHGFKIYVVSNTSTAVLDSPLPQYLAKIQSSLRSGESRQLMAPLSATISLHTPNYPCRISRRQHRIESLEEIDHAINEELSEISGDLLEKLARSFKRKLNLHVKAKGSS